jgi:hypothetical protein
MSRGEFADTVVFRDLARELLVPCRGVDEQPILVETWLRLMRDGAIHDKPRLGDVVYRE